jgi:ABC-2 type transport system ATP-binding protein
MIHQPELLILDEPTTGVDPVSRSGLWWLVARAAAEGCAVVLSTSYLDEAERCTSVLVLDAGATLASGTPAEIISAMPGSLWEASAKPNGRSAELAWRSGGHWRVWDPDSDDERPDVAGADEAEMAPVEPDLQDAVTAAALGLTLQGSTS